MPFAIPPTSDCPRGEGGTVTRVGELRNKFSEIRSFRQLIEFIARICCVYGELQEAAGQAGGNQAGGFGVAAQSKQAKEAP